MRKLFLTTLSLLAVGLTGGPALAAAEIGQPAPAISATDIHGNEFNLSDHEGKIVVLEWTNHQCPYVIKHYDSGNMQNIQKNARAEGVEWVRIISSAEGMQGYVTDEEAKALIEESGADITTQIADPSGEIGQAYGAKTTPHMFVIDEEGTLVYAGAIDDQPSPRESTLEGAENYVVSAIESLQAGEEVSPSQTAPYGCGVKYAN